MKAVVAFIRPSKEEAVTDALRAVDGLTGASFTPIRGFGRGRGDRSRRELDEAVSGTMPQVRLDVMTSDALAPKVAAVITEAAHTGNRGDGKVYVYSVDSAVRISTRETGELAYEDRLGNLQLARCVRSRMSRGCEFLWVGNDAFNARTFDRGRNALVNGMCFNATAARGDGSEHGCGLIHAGGNPSASPDHEGGRVEAGGLCDAPMEGGDHRRYARGHRIPQRRRKRDRGGEDEFPPAQSAQNHASAAAACVFADADPDTVREPLSFVRTKYRQRSPHEFPCQTETPDCDCTAVLPLLLRAAIWKTETTETGGKYMRDVHEHLSKEDHECLHNCEDCHDACLHQIQHCLEKGGNHERPEHIRLLQDCSQICHTSADFIMRGSLVHGVICEACAQVCDACAKACAELGDTKCADICRRCAESCHGMMSHRH